MIWRRILTIRRDLWIWCLEILPMLIPKIPQGCHQDYVHIPGMIQHSCFVKRKTSRKHHNLMMTFFCKRILTHPIGYTRRSVFISIKQKWFNGNLLQFWLGKKRFSHHCWTVSEMDVIHNFGMLSSFPGVLEDGHMPRRTFKTKWRKIFSRWERSQWKHSWHKRYNTALHMGTWLLVTVKNCNRSFYMSIAKMWHSFAKYKMFIGNSNCDGCRLRCGAYQHHASHGLLQEVDEVLQIVTG